jgi:hypothetical protein
MSWTGMTTRQACLTLKQVRTDMGLCWFVCLICVLRGNWQLML